MPTIPDWLIVSKGHLTAVVLTPQTNTNGVLADGTPVTLTGKLSSLGADLTPEKSEVNTITSPRHNNIVIGDGFQIRIAVLKVNGGGDVDPLRTAILSNDVFKLSWQEGLVTPNINTVTCYASRGPYSFDAAGRGEVIATLSFDSVDPGAADFFKVVKT